MPPWTTTLFLEYLFKKFNTSFKKGSKILKSFFNTIMLRCVFKKSQNMSLNFFQIVLLMLKLLLSCFYATFKQWLQEVKNSYTYFSLIRLIANFYDMYIMYSK